MSLAWHNFPVHVMPENFKSVGQSYAIYQITYNRISCNRKNTSKQKIKS